MQQKALGAHEVTNTEVAMHQSGQHSGKQAKIDCFSTHRFWEAYPGLGGPMVLKALALMWSSPWWPLWPWSNGKK